MHCSLKRTKRREDNSIRLRICLSIQNVEKIALFPYAFA